MMTAARDSANRRSRRFSPTEPGIDLQVHGKGEMECRGFAEERAARSEIDEEDSEPSSQMSVGETE
jgi:hypothetical protein